MREAIVHVFELRGVVDPLIGSEREEVPKHDFDNRTGIAANPLPMPTMAGSLIGVLRTRPG